MKQTETNEFVAQGAATWQEREEHDRIMKALDNVRGFVDSYFYINGNCYYWSTKPLPEEEALAIAQRGRHDEIMYMIHQYGRAKCPGDQQQHLHHVHTCLLTQSVQVIIARRNNREEMDAFLLYNGFEELGQDIVLDREDHEEIMRYVDRHGFKLKQQRRLKQRGNKDEIGLHIARHGLADELLDEMFDEIAAGGSIDEYYQFIERNQFRPAYQRRMLQTVGTDAFKAYADRYGLWEEVHGDLIEYRLPSDVLSSPALLSELGRREKICPQSPARRQGLLRYKQKRRFNQQLFMGAVYGQTVGIRLADRMFPEADVSLPYCGRRREADARRLSSGSYGAH